ncbi:hypothetical protein C5S36_10190, partial [Candidatus Methanophagaceae archaeon]
MTIKSSFSKLIDEIGVIKAKVDLNNVFKKTRTRNYYELSGFRYFRLHKKLFKLAQSMSSEDYKIEIHFMAFAKGLPRNKLAILLTKSLYYIIME